MRGAMAFLAGMGAGYLNGEKEKEKQKRQDKLDGQQDELHAAKIDEIKRSQQDRTNAQAAAAPATVSEMQGPQTEDVINATPMMEQPKPLGYIAGNGTSARGFAEKGVADANAVDQNKPEARRTRMADLAMQGNAFASTALTQDMQREASQITINEGRRKEADAVFDTGARTALQTKGPKGLAEFMSASAADGNGGATKFKEVISPDNKSWQIHRVNEDGTTAPIGNPFSNDEDGYAMAGFMLSRAVPDSEKVKHLMDVADKKLKQANEDRDFGIKEGGLKVQQQNADTQERWRKDQSAAAFARAGADGGGGGGGGVPGVALKDLRDYLSDFSNGLEDPKTALDPAQAIAIQQRNQKKLADADAIFSTNAAFGTVLTAPQAHAAMSLAQDPKNVRNIRDNNTGKVYEAVQVNGQSVVLGIGSVRQPAPSNTGGSAASPEVVFANIPTKKLTEMAKKPRGVSSYEASQAQQEIDRRRNGPQELKAW